MSCNWRFLWAVLLVLGAFLPVVVGCGSDGDEEESPAPQEDGAMVAAKKYYEANCVRCHAVEGDGSGPDGVPILEKEGKGPRNFHDKEWQKSVTDEKIELVILHGGKKRGLLDDMPANPLLTDKPEVVAALRQIVRDFGK